MVFAVRKGNPKNIQTWDDLVTGDVEIITPNPFTSGGAQWNLMAAYGAQLEQGKSEEEALDFLKQILENTPVQDESAREALQTFVGGKGDVLLAYENEAIAAQQDGEDIDYVIPDETILIENPVAVTEDADREGAGLPRLPLHRGGAEDLPGQGLPPGPEAAGRTRRSSRPRRAVRDRQVRRLGQGPVGVLRPGERLGREDRGGAGCRHLRLAPRLQPKQFDCRPGRGAASAAPRWALASRPPT